MDNLAGRTLGQYAINKLIGRGGMASVYLARQHSIGRMVAVKVLPSHLMSDETFQKRFQREVKAVALMQHPHIIPVHDYGEDDGIPYIVMAHIEGGSLAQLIQEKGALPLGDVVRLIEQIASGLDYAHQQGVIHRDFKPSNVLLDKQNNAYLSDFGIAKVSQETVQLTGSGIVGTPTYMAPEMFKQELPTPAVDIYALGVTLYQMLSGTTPFEGTTPVQLMYSHLNEPVPSIASVRQDIPAAVQIVLDKAMAKRPEDRFSTAQELADMLRRAAEGDTLEMTVVPPPPAATQVVHPASMEKQRAYQPVAIRPSPAPTGIRRNWQAALALAIMVLSILWMTRPGLIFLLALIGALVLLGTHIQMRQWKSMILWLVFPLLGLLSILVQVGGESPGFGLKLLLLGCAITGFVVEMRHTSKTRKTSDE
ncbi:MAG: serine/threonine protein kinase [Anaerolineae bacterium]|nr:serine/threonine protein kinase [Anaerolineae bacterium]